MRRAARSVIGALLLTIGWTVATTATATPAAAATCGPAPSGQVAVVVVVDRGSGAPAQHCVTVPQRSSGMEALVTTGLAVNQRGGFVCAIGGLPASGCAIDDPNAPSWSYWHADPGGTWTYSSIGAAGYRLPERCAVEGWSFGPANHKAAPRVAPPAVRCEQPAPPARPAPAPTAPPSGGGGGAPAAPQPGGTDAGGAGGAAGSPGGTGDGAGKAAEPDAPTSTAAPTTAPEVSAAEDPTGPSAGDETSSKDGDEREGAVNQKDGERAGSSDQEVGLPMGATSSSSDGGSWVGAAVVAVLLAALGGGAVLRSRRSGRAPGSD